MFGSKRRRIEELKKQVKQLEVEKEELLKFKKCAGEKNTKISVSDIYVIDIRDCYKIAKLEVTEFELGINLINWRLVLTDVFTGEVIHKKTKNEKLLKAEWDSELSRFITITPVFEFEPSLLDYPDKKVSLDILQDLSDKLNGLKLSTPKVKSKIKEK